MAQQEEETKRQVVKKKRHKTAKSGTWDQKNYADQGNRKQESAKIEINRGESRVEGGPPSTRKGQKLGSPQGV